MKPIFISFVEREELAMAESTHRCVCRFVQPYQVDSIAA
jgi:hypothetical protein